MLLKNQYFLTELKDIRTVVDEVMRLIFSERRVTEEKTFQIKLVLNELLTNSFKHTKPSKSSPVKLEMELNADAISVTIQDNGCGFDTENWRKPANEWELERLYQDRGRGLLLVSQMTSELKFKRNGQEVFAKIEL